MTATLAGPASKGKSAAVGVEDGQVQGASHLTHPRPRDKILVTIHFEGKMLQQGVLVLDINVAAVRCGTPYSAFSIDYFIPFAQLESFELDGADRFIHMTGVVRVKDHSGTRELWGDFNMEAENSNTAQQIFKWITLSRSKSSSSTRKESEAQQEIQGIQTQDHPPRADTDDNPLYVSPVQSKRDTIFGKRRTPQGDNYSPLLTATDEPPPNTSQPAQEMGRRRIPGFRSLTSSFTRILKK